MSRGFTFSGQDQNEGPERVFAGVAGVRIKSVTLTMSNGGHLKIYPVLPNPSLRKRFIWLRNMRYFVQYYPDGSHVRLVTARNFKGKLVARVGGLEGSFSAFCSPVSEDCGGERT